MCADRQRGFTLLELVVTLVILGVAFAAIAGLVGTLVGGRASPDLQTQALYIAEGYLEEAMLKAYADPENDPPNCAASRDLWDDIGDYACLATESSPTDSAAESIAGPRPGGWKCASRTSMAISTFASRP